MSFRAHDAGDVRHRAGGAGICLVGESPAFLALLRSVDQIARHAVPPVLICGETGTGKELVARAIHYLGPRRAFPFVPVNCGAIPDFLVENELFGHRAGAFTGATSESRGLLRLAHGGTLFLDEVDALPAKTQVTLLRFLQDGHFRPLGAAKEEYVDVRILAASNRRLEDEIRAGRFREDLYFRLNLIALDVPPLRERTGDVRVLSQYFLQKWAECYRLPPKRLQDATMGGLCQYPWPGNVRELENLIHRACLLCDGDELTISLPAHTAPPVAPPIVAAGEEDALPYRVARSRALQAFDRSYLTQLMQRTRGNVTKAARLAGKERRALGKLLKLYAIGYVPDHRDN